MRVSELQLKFCRDRATIITAIIPKHVPLLSDISANLGTPRIELSEENNEILCGVYIGNAKVEEFYVADFMP